MPYVTPSRGIEVPGSGDLVSSVGQWKTLADSVDAAISAPLTRMATSYTPTLNFQMGINAAKSYRHAESNLATIYGYMEVATGKFPAGTAALTVTFQPNAVAWQQFVGTGLLVRSSGGTTTLYPLTLMGVGTGVFGFILNGATGPSGLRWMGNTFSGWTAGDYVVYSATYIAGA